MNEAEKMIERWRFEKLRRATTDALRLSAALLASKEGVCELDHTEEYQALVELNRVLAGGIFEGVQL